MTEPTRFCSHEDPKNPGRFCTKEPHTEGRHRYPPKQAKNDIAVRRILVIEGGLSLSLFLGLVGTIGRELTEAGAGAATLEAEGENFVVRAAIE